MQLTPSATAGGQLQGRSMAELRKFVCSWHGAREVCACGCAGG